MRYLCVCSVTFSTQTKDRQKTVEYVLSATAQLPTKAQFVMPNLNAELGDVSSSDIDKKFCLPLV